MKTKHTQGEWQIRNAIPQEGKCISIKKTNQLAVGINVDNDILFEAIAFVGNEKNKQAQANAKLIAAAPDLLDSAMHLIDELNNVSVEFPEHTWDILNKIEKAIEKATK